VYAVEDFSLSVVKGSLGGLASTDDDASAKNFRACHFHRFALQGFCVGVGLPRLVTSIVDFGPAVKCKYYLFLSSVFGLFGMTFALQ
jgi:hypothetical protein